MTNIEEFLNNPTYRHSLKIEKNLKGILKNKKNSLTIAIGGNCNTDFMIPSIKAYFALHQKKINFISLKYNNWQSELISQSIQPDFWIIWLSTMGMSNGGTATNKFDSNSIKSATKLAASRGEKIIFIMPEFSIMEKNPFSPFVQWRKNIIQKILNNVTKDTSIYYPDLAINYSGHASRYWSSARLPCHPDSISKIGIDIANMIELSIKRKIKAFAVDLDDTLWGGIVGDVGYENVQLDHNGLGRPYLEMQKFLKDQSKLGIPIFIVSKNNYNLAMDVFNRRNEMIIKKRDILGFHISWEPKYKAIKEISKQLNIFEDSICFIDDSLHEREEAKKFLPQLIIPSLDANPETRVSKLLDTGMFNISKTEKEDRNRIQMFKADIKRTKDKEQTGDINEYLKSLKMELDILPFDDINISRVSSLIEKTNQFNVTNKKTRLLEIRNYINREDIYCVCGQLKDKYGESGIIYALIAKKDKTTIKIIEWVMSCRVFGRQVEVAALDHLIKWTLKQSQNIIKFNYLPTKKNAYLKEVFKNLDIKLTNNVGTIKLDNYRRIKTPIRINEKKTKRT